jgi:DNA-binding CsgD family transcriptional regulator
MEVRASAGLAKVPFGPFRKLIVAGAGGTEDLPSNVQDLSSAIVRELLDLRASEGLIVLVEDAHDLDDASAGLLHQLVTAGSVCAILTTRVAVKVPSSVTDLWKDGFADRIELQALSRQQTVELVQHVLAGTLEASSTDRLCQLTGGNPLYIREVLLASLDSGALQQIDGVWRWKGEWASATRLQEIVAHRLSDLAPEELGVVETLAVGGSLPLSLLEGLFAGETLESLEERKLIRIELAGRRLEVSLTHAVHADVTRSTMTELQQRAVRRNLLDALAGTPARRSDDAVKQALWSRELGLEVDPVALSLGADALVFKIGHDFAARLDDIIGATVGAPSRVVTPGSSDPSVACNLARVAYERSGRLADGLLYAQALSWIGSTDEAERLLGELAERATVDEDRVRLALARGWISFWGRHDPATAQAVLLAAAEDPGKCPPEVLAEVYEQLAGITLNTGFPRAALTFTEQVSRILGRDVSETVAAPPAAACMSYLGRCEVSLAIVDRGIAAVGTGTGLHPLTLPTLLYTRAACLSRTGRLDESRILAETCRDVAIATGSIDGAALFGVLLGEIHLRQGKPASAARMFRDSSGLLAERDVYGYRPWALSGLARARAALGDADGAAASLSLARSLQPIERLFDASAYLAEAHICLLRGAKADAHLAIGAGIDWARRGELLLEEAILLEALIHVDRSVDAARRLSEIAGITDSQLVASLARIGEGLVHEQAGQLLSASEDFARMASWWYAAEAAAAAALVLARQGDRRASQSAARAAFEHVSNCEGARTTFVAELSAPASLTRRETEISRLACEGRSNKQIAERLFLSERTVESHLQRAYIKLGVNDRAELADALASAETR